VNIAAPSRREGGQTAILDPKEHAFYEAIEVVAGAQKPIHELLKDIRYLLTQMVELQMRTNKLLEQHEQRR
jgi:hypothetical protein